MCFLRAMGSMGSSLQKRLTWGWRRDRVQLSSGREPTSLCLPAHRAETSQHVIVCLPEQGQSSMSASSPSCPVWTVFKSSSHHFLRLGTQEHSPGGLCRILTIGHVGNLLDWKGRASGFHSRSSLKFLCIIPKLFFPPLVLAS